MRKRTQAKEKPKAPDRHSGEGAQSALERLRELEKAKAVASTLRPKRKFFG
jgi:hypothetical protein